MQLVAYGAQDLYLTGNPQITFFKTIYRRHTNFSLEYIPQYYRVLPSFSTTQANKLTVKINRNADLIYDCYVAVQLPSIYSTKAQNFQWIENLGQNMILSVELLCNGVLIDKHYAEWLNVWAQLTIDRSKRRAYDEITGNTWDLRFPETFYGNYSPTTYPTYSGRMLYIPLFFAFCVNPGLSLPLIALQYTEIFMNVEFSPLNRLFTMWYGLSPETFYEYATSGGQPTAGIPDVDYQMIQAIEAAGLPEVSAADLNSTLSIVGLDPTNYFWFFANGTQAPNGTWNQNSYIYVNYVFLDEDERRRFAQTSHEYLITQLQLQEFTGIDGPQTLELKISQPVKELIFTTRRTDVYLFNQWNNYTNCMYFNSLYDVSFVKNAMYFKQQREFYDAGIQTCLPDVSNQFPQDNQFQIDQKQILYIAKLLLNSNDRFDFRDPQFFNGLVPFKYHTNSPDIGINCYSFALNPEEFQPSGTCNFSRINRAQIQMTLRQVVNTEIEYDVNVFAHNVNVFRVMGGIGSIVFTN